MSRDYVEDLIESAHSKFHPDDLRKGWVIQAKSRLSDLNKELEKLEKELNIK